MKPIKILTMLLPVFFLIGAAKAQDEFVKGKIYLKLKDNQPVESEYVSSEVEVKRDISLLDPFMQEFKIKRAERPFWFANIERLNRIFRIEISEDSEVDVLINILKQRKEVEYAERIPLRKLDLTPDDIGPNSTSTTDYGQYALYNVHAMEAWDLCQGERDDIVLPILDQSIVAIVDNAFDLDHPDLADQFIGGYDVSDDDADPSYPSTNFDHGTHCAGIAGASTNNGKGISSLGYNLKIMPIKATPDDGDPEYIYDGYDGILMAAILGARIISCSWGGYIPSDAEEDIVESVINDFGCVVVAAAGNDAALLPLYPASYDGVINVASVDINDVKASSSNFGSGISVCAPGVKINSTVPNNTYGRMSGTSMATPLVASLCGLIRIIDPTMSPANIKDLIESTADNIDAENPLYPGLLGAGRINAYEALKAILPCYTTITLDDIDVAKVEASVSISASGNVNADQLTLDAGSYVDLKEGFIAGDGHQLIVINDGCGGAKFASGSNEDGTTGSTDEMESSIALIENEASLQVFPNPASTSVTIALDINMASTVSVYLLDISGRKLRTILEREPLNAGKYTKQIDCSDLPPGIYQCVMMEDGKAHNSKLVVQH